MGAFDKLEEDLKSQQDSGCDTSSDVKEYVETYRDKVYREMEKLKQQQQQDRDERS